MRCRTSIVAVAVVALSIPVLLGACSDGDTDKYVGMRIYGDSYIDSVEDYEEIFPILCSWINESEMRYSTREIERIGLRTLAINDNYDAAGVGYLSVSSTGPEADAMRDFIAIHSDEAVIHQCAWRLDEWLAPGTRTSIDMEDVVNLPVREFIGLP